MACTRDRSVNAPYDNQLSYEFATEDLDAEAANGLALSLITEDGTRDVPIALEIAAQETPTSTSISIPDQSYLDRSIPTQADAWQLFGREPAQEFSKKLQTRFEIFNPEQARTQPVIQYMQQTQDYTQHDRMMGKSVQQSWSFKQVGVASVVVTNQAGEPVEMAQVSVLPHINHMAIDPSERMLYRGVMNLTTSEGNTRIFPIPFEEPGAGFQIVAAAANHCTHVSRVYGAEEILANKPFEIQLKTCNIDETDGPSPVFISFPNAETIEQSTEDQPTVTASTNRELLDIRIDYLGKSIRPLDIRLFSQKDQSEQESGVQESDLMIPISSVTLNLSKASQNQETADLALFVGPKLSEQDHASGSAPELTSSLVSYSKTAPEFQPNQVQFSSSVGIKNVISGQKKGFFFLDAAGCKRGSSIALYADRGAPLESLHFVPCTNSLLRIESKTLGYSEQESGGWKAIYARVKDKFGNLSPEPTPDSFADVYVDFSSADLTKEQPVLVPEEFGLQLKSDKNNSDEGDEPGKKAQGGGPKKDPKLDARAEVSEEFLSDLEEEGISIIGPDNMKNFSLGFINPLACRHSNPNDGDGSGEASDVGHHIYDWAISDKPADLIKDAATSNRCSARVKLDKVLDPDKMSKQILPVLYLRIHDLAGNPSSLQSIQFPHCTEILLEEIKLLGACWLP
jgi:hypothetical protein